MKKTTILAVAILGAASVFAATIAFGITTQFFQTGTGSELEASGTDTFDITTTSTTGGPLFIRSRGAVSGGVYINTSNNVGIGTVNPNYKLDVQGTARFTQPVIVGTPTTSTQAATKGYVDAAIAGSAAITLTTTIAGTPQGTMDACLAGYNPPTCTTGSQYLSCPAGYTEVATIEGSCWGDADQNYYWDGALQTNVESIAHRNCITVCEK